MALNFQPWGDPNAKQKLEQEQMNQFNQTLGNISNEAIQRRQQALQNALAQQEAGRANFLFQREYAPQPGTPIDQSLSPNLPGSTSLFQGNQGRGVLDHWDQTYPHLSSQGMSRADVKENLANQVQQSDIEKNKEMAAMYKAHGFAYQNPKPGASLTTIYQDPSTGQISAEFQEGWLPRNITVADATKQLAGSYQKNVAPTTQARNMGEMANTVIPHVQTLRNTIHEAAQKGFIGPVAGRVYGEFLAGKVGSTGNPDADRLLGSLRSQNQLMNSAVLRTHMGGRGGQLMMEHFNNMLNTGKQSEAELNGVLDTIKDYMSGYAGMAGVKGQEGVNSHPQDDQAIQWAQQNPQDPRAKEILKLNGAR